MITTRSRRGFVHLWRWPTAIAILTVFGLISALIGHGGVWWGLSWAALAIPIIVIMICIQRRRRP
jgi:hypothetical protein